MTPDERATELLAQFSSSDTDVTWLLCDQHPAERVAFTFVAEDGSVSTLTFGELRRSSELFARALKRLGVGPGDRVATLMGKGPDLVNVITATWRLGAVYVPLFTAFAHEAIALRLEGSDTKVVVTDPDQRPKLEPEPGAPAERSRTIVVTGSERPNYPGDALLADLLAADDGEPVKRVAVGGDGAVVHMFTSGTTGKPKGVIHSASYIAGWQIYVEYSLGLTPDDTFWCAADPGWAYGLYTALAGTLAAGVPSILLAGGFGIESTWQTIEDLKVTDFAAAPTVYRALRATVPVPSGLSLRRASSVGEPLTPEVNEWAVPTLGLTVHDHFGLTEVGMVLANHHHSKVKHAVKTRSAGRAIPGWTVTVLNADDDGPAASGQVGRLAIEIASSPLMTFTTYQDPRANSARFTADRRFCLTGDAAHVDDDGDFFFSARDDDVIIMAGYRIGPVEIESILAQHPLVAECGVIGAPDELRGEVIEAYVVLRDGIDQSPELATELQQLVKTRYAAHAYPRTVHFIPELPKTPSGKVQRFVLRQQRQERSAEASR